MQPFTKVWGIIAINGEILFSFIAFTFHLVLYPIHIVTTKSTTMIDVRINNSCDHNYNLLQ